MIISDIMSLSLSHTFEMPEVKEATLTLISDNSNHLINYIYKNKSKAPYNIATTRVGLVMKTLLKTDSTSQLVTAATLEPVMEDLNILIKDSKDARIAEVYKEELRFLRSCTILDDMITLNTVS